MDIVTNYTAQDTILTIDIGDKFDFTKVEAFHNAYEEVKDSVKHIAIDLSKTEYMDSSALGMLLNMQKKLADRSLTYSIDNAKPQVVKILEISRFDKKFDIK